MTSANALPCFYFQQDSTILHDFILQIIYNFSRDAILDQNTSLDQYSLVREKTRKGRATKDGWFYLDNRHMSYHRNHDIHTQHATINKK